MVGANSLQDFSAMIDVLLSDYPLSKIIPIWASVSTMPFVSMITKFVAIFSTLLPFDSDLVSGLMFFPYIFYIS